MGVGGELVPSLRASCANIYGWHAVLIPMALVDEVGWIVIPLSTVVSFVFLFINLISQSLEDPFEGRLNDVPLTALCRTIEINLREQLGEADLPDKVEAVNGFLL